MAIIGSGDISCSISAIGNSGARSSGPAGSPVPGCSGGSGSPGRSGSRLTQCVGMASSPRTYFVVLIAPNLRLLEGGWAAGLVRPGGPEAQDGKRVSEREGTARCRSWRGNVEKPGTGTLAGGCGDLDPA